MSAVRRSRRSGSHEPAPAPRSEGSVRFAALRDSRARPYLISSGLAMMGDHIEHVITYWVLWQTFHSPGLVGFQIVSHWLPFLALSMWFGSLAERHDCRRLIQCAQGAFALGSVLWGLLFLTGALQVWMACILLLLHGVAGALWGPAEQMILHDLVEPPHLPSAVRLNATFRRLGVLLGPVVGSALLLGLGAVAGILINVLCYLPMLFCLQRTAATGHLGDAPRARTKVSVLDTVAVLRSVRGNPSLLSMILLSGLVAVTIGAVLQPAMPTFAENLGTRETGLLYASLLLANGIGGVLGGFVLEATQAIRPSPRAAIGSAVAFGAAIAAFASTPSYGVAIAALVVGGVTNMASMATAQTVVQLQAPPKRRGRVLGIYSTFASGFGTFGGVSIAALSYLAGGVIASVAVGALLLMLGALGLGLYLRRSRPRLPLPDT